MTPPRFILLLFLSLFLSHSLFSQQVLNGILSGRSGQPVAGASIINNTTKKGTVSDSSGRFSIDAIQGAVLEISCIGYISQRVVVKNGSEIILQLSETQNNLNEVVRIGYGTTLRKDVTGAVSGISANQFNVGVITNPLQEIEGKVAAVVIVQPGGDPNGDYIVRIRGATSLTGQPPLLVIDGVAVDSFQIAINTLNPADIESFTILKDASSAAIYGSRGANGVILVTTKRGRAGKQQVEYDGFVSLETVSHELNVLNADQWRKATAGDSASSLDQGANTDWQKAITRTAFTQNHLLAISGGTNQLSYRGSIGYIDQQGIVINSGKKMVSARLNVDQKSLGDKLEIRYGFSGSVTNRDLLHDQTSTNQATGGSSIGGSDIFLHTYFLLPVTPVYNPDGSYYLPPPANPIYILDETYSKLKENFFQGSVKADYEIFKGLRAGVLGALSEGDNTFDFFQPAEIGGISAATKSNSNKQNFTGDMHTNYQKNFGKQSIDITGVYEYNKFENDGFAVNAQGFLVPDPLNNNLGAATIVQPNDISSYKNEVVLISFLGRMVYAYDNRYILTASFRRDGSSKFGPENAWGNFPSLAVAWRASNEEFLHQVQWLSNLKFRVSYGYTGNSENLPPNQYQLLYSPGVYQYNNTILTSYSASQEYNPDLKWEVRKSFNIGMDFAVLKDRISGTVDVFNDKTSDMLYLYDLPQPPFQNSQVYANSASAVNKGIEISLNAIIIRNKKFSWDIQGNLSTVKNYITQLLGQFQGANLYLSNTGFGSAFGGAFNTTYVTRLAQGHPAGVFWIPQHAGFDVNGNELFNKYNSQGKLTGTSTSFTDTDRVFIDPTAKYTWGFTSSFNLGNFNLSFLLRGVEGQKIFANSLLNLGNTYLLPGNNVVKEALTDGFSQLPQPSTFWLRDGSFIRCENLTLGYNFKNLKGISRLRLYVVATNLFVITKYAGVDPEVSTDGTQRYIDATYYPKSRGFTFGVNLGF
jgi:TonB-dependent starch-binding outer membrane protein SusC